MWAAVARRTQKKRKMQHPPNSERGIHLQPAARIDKEQTPWEQHLQKIYDGDADEIEGLLFFGTRGYYDTSREHNCVDAFCKRLGLSASWLDPQVTADEEAVAYVLRLGRQSDDTCHVNGTGHHLTPWETHLESIYNGDLNDLDALQFFESHDYFDASEGRMTLAQIFVDAVGLESFWGQLQ